MLLLNRPCVIQSHNQPLVRVLPTKFKAKFLSASVYRSALWLALSVFTLSSHPSQAFGSQNSGLPSSETSSSGKIAIAEAGIKIAVPEGWTHHQDIPGLTLVMKEPADPKPAYDKPKYQRNITLMTLHQSSPMDFSRMESLKAHLVEQFAKNPSVADFQIVESKLFDYRQKNDGILVYTSLKMGEYPMMQMHVLVSGEKKQYLMTYTDLAERFQESQDPVFASAWASIVSIEVEGVPPTRFEEQKSLYLGATSIFLIFAAMGLWSLKQRRKSYRHFADIAVNGKNIDDGEGVKTISGSGVSTFGDLQCSTY